MAKITTAGIALFPAQLTTDLFSKVKGHSTLAKLNGGSPIPFSGTETFVFSMDGEASIVGEGTTKPAGEATLTSVTIRPIKFVYQHRLTDEFVSMSEEQQLPYLRAFTDGFAAKIARALDIAAIHGVNPYDGAESDTVGTNCFAKAVTASVTYDAAAPDDNIDDAVKPIQAADGDVSGVAMSTAFASALGAMKAADSNLSIYPEYRFAGNPGTFGGISADVNTTIAFGTSKIRAIVGDFAGAFRWGYAPNIPMEIIQYGNPDGQGDLKAQNQIVLRAEAYIGWGILVPSSFALISEAGA